MFQRIRTMVAKPTDVVLLSELDGKRFPCHRALLVLKSPFFGEYFRRLPTFRGLRPHVFPLEVSGEQLLPLLQFCYTSVLYLPDAGENYSAAKELFAAAALLGFYDAFHACTEVLKKRIDISNCFSALKLAVELELADVETVAMDYIIAHFVQLWEKAEFLQLSFAQVNCLLASNKLNAPAEVLVLKSIMTWMWHDEDARYALIPNLLELVRLRYLVEDYTRSYVALLCAQFHCTQLLSSTHDESIKRRSAQSWNLLVAYLQDATCTVSAYGVETEVWTNFGSIKPENPFFLAVKLNESLIIIGDRCQSIDLKYEMQKDLAPVPTARQYFGAAVLEGLLYVVSGCDEEFCLEDAVERYDPVTKTWSEVASIPTARTNVGLAALDGLLYAFGGGDERIQCLSVTECYDPRTDTWTERASMNLGRRWHGAVAACGFIYAIGGLVNIVDGNTETKTVERYDPHVDKWIHVCSLVNIGHGIDCAFIGDRLVSICSTNAFLEEYDFSTDTWISTDFSNFADMLRGAKCRRMIAVSNLDMDWS